ncbi:MEKHLA domain-containing protein [Frankia sp. Mgl5]|uniref:MEKHLA domain-containing protein n=1 Tax=Frankia sp. Mgl5 TaxID=2933793 RepID=UPI00200FAAE6|nr:MEKHLA domain-containing protein [Frankia sp. Mgl5]MCK9926949.1 MEKHLA domain-containing protein [Frankia sp. Mgl5]
MPDTDRKPLGGQAVRRPAGSSVIGPYDSTFAELLTDSYQRLLGEPMLPGGDPAGGDATGGDAARWLYDAAPFGLLAHDASTDPLFVYANRTAQQRFEYTWDEFVGMPSRLSARPAGRDERRRLMDGVLLRGYASDCRGERTARSGRRFWIEDTTIWNLLDREGVLHGQAALIRGWTDA